MKSVTSRSLQQQRQAVTPSAFASRGGRALSARALVVAQASKAAAVQEPLMVRASRGEVVERAPCWMMRQAGRCERTWERGKTTGEACMRVHGAPPAHERGKPCTVAVANMAHVHACMRLQSFAISEMHYLRPRGYCRDIASFLAPFFPNALLFPNAGPPSHSLSQSASGSRRPTGSLPRSTPASASAPKPPS